MILAETLTTEEIGTLIDRPGLTILYFTAPWCGPCLTFGPVMEQLSLDHPDYRVVKIDADQAKNLVDLFQVKGIPTLILFRQGTQLTSWIGGLTREKLNSVIEQASF